MVDTGPKASVSCTCVAASGSAQWNSIGGTKAPFWASAPSTAKASGSPKTRVASDPIRAAFSSTSRRCDCETSAPIFVPSRRGSPMVTLASRSDSAAISASTWGCGTMIRRMAVHFCPALAVISRWTSFTNRSNSGEPGPASDPNTEALRLSCSDAKRTERSTNTGVLRSFSAVSAEPVKLTTS